MSRASKHKCSVVVETSTRKLRLSRVEQEARKVNKKEKKKEKKTHKIMKLNKQVLMALVVLAVSKSVYAACANREKDDDSSDLYADIKCGLSTAKDKIKDVGSSVGSSLKDGSVKAYDAISKVAVKTGSVIVDGYNVAVEKGKSGYDLVRDAITGTKAAEYRDGEGLIEVRMATENVKEI